MYVIWTMLCLKSIVYKNVGALDEAQQDGMLEQHIPYW
mgnify:FL=1